MSIIRVGDRAINLGRPVWTQTADWTLRQRFGESSGRLDVQFGDRTRTGRRAPSLDFTRARFVYFEEVNDIHAALQRENQLKRWTRKWKLELIEKVNPKWRDLAEDFILEMKKL